MCIRDRGGGGEGEIDWEKSGRRQTDSKTLEMRGQFLILAFNCGFEDWTQTFPLSNLTSSTIQTMVTKSEETLKNYIVECEIYLNFRHLRTGLWDGREAVDNKISKNDFQNSQRAVTIHIKQQWHIWNIKNGESVASKIGRFTFTNAQVNFALFPKNTWHRQPQSDLCALEEN